jgi:hypothetical protein
MEPILKILQVFLNPAIWIIALLVAAIVVGLIE